MRSSLSLLLAGLLAIAPFISASATSKYRPPADVSSFGSWIFDACIAESPEGPALPVPMTPKGGSNSLENCAGACQDAGYYYAGVEDGTNCSCGQSGITPGGSYVDEVECEVLPCPGNADEYCGAENRLLLYIRTD